MMKKIGITLGVLFAVEVIGCGWFWNQKPVCDENSPTYRQCMDMLPLPPMAKPAPSDAGPDASDVSTDANKCVGDSDTAAPVCPADTNFCGC